MDEENTQQNNNNSEEIENLLPLDFEEAAQLMSEQQPIPAPSMPSILEVGSAFPAPPEPTAAQAPMELRPEAVPLVELEGTPAPAAPVTPAAGNLEETQSNIFSAESSSRRPSKTFADELSKSKSRLTISFGETIRVMRETRGISLAEVADKTKIRKDYLEALETEDFKRLPPAVFVCGYVRKICDLYEVPRNVNDDIIKQLKEHADYKLSEDNIDSMIEHDHEAGPEAEQRIRNILWLAAGIFLFIVAIVGTIILLSMSKREKDVPARLAGSDAPPAVIATFDVNSLNALTPPQVIRLTELPIPEN